jgi:hypothetical protein
MKNIHLILFSMLTSFLLTACGGDHNHSHNSSSSVTSTASSMLSSSSASSSSTPMTKFSITVTNLTAGQPLSPTAVVLHTSNFKAFEVGMPASVELEKIAESGNPDPFLADAATNTSTFASTKASSGIPPGMTTTIMIEAQIADANTSMLRLTALSMLGNTNDGFTGLNGVDISKIVIGDSMVIDTISYDAGTEKNTESAATVPGPAAGGEGFNPMRDDSPSTVAMHSGVLTKDDGNPGSALTSINRWDNPVARIVITRMSP